MMKLPTSVRRCSWITFLVFFLGLPALAADRQSYFRDLVIAKNESLETVVCFFCTIHVQGQTAVAIALLGGVEISGAVNGTVVTVGGGVTLLAGASVQGNIVAIGGSVEKASGALLPSDVMEYAWIHLPGQRQIFWKGALSLLGLTLLLTFLSYALLRKRRTENIVAMLRGRKIATFLTGLSAFALMLLVMIYGEEAGDWGDYLVLGAPVVFLLLSLPGLPAVALISGRLILRNHAASAGAILSGAIFVVLLMLLPVAGFLLCLLSMCLSIGALVLSRFGGCALLASLPAETSK